MSKAGKYWVLAIIMAVLGLVEAVSGFVLWVGFPTGGGGAGRHGGLGDLTYWELSKHTWIDIHDWVAVALIAMVTVHIIVHWKWIVRMARTLFKRTHQRLEPAFVKNDN